MKEFYNNNANFKDYVDKFSKHYGMSVEEALSQEIIKQVYLYYKKKEEET